MKESREAFRFFLDRRFRAGVMWAPNGITAGASVQKTDLRGEDINRILLVRSLFRMGDLILATPAILFLRKYFPQATLDFVGPEETETLVYLQSVLGHRVPVVFEPNIRSVASMVTHCDLIVACDSGPAHLACALRVRTVVLFLQANFARWAPPPSLARIVFRQSGVAATDVLESCRIELGALCGESVTKIANG